jgi:uncharacterized membrane protein YfcA
MNMDVFQVVAGWLTGLIVGLTGVGGGALMTPILLFFFGVAPLTAVGTDLWFAAGTKLFAFRVHHASNLIDWGVLKRLWSGSLIASLLTILILHVYPPDKAFTGFMNTGIAAAIMLTALGIIFQKQLHALGRRLRLTDAGRFKLWQGPLTILAGAVLGVLVTLTSIGAGALGAVFLTYLYPLRLTPPRLIATDIVHAIPLAIFAGMGHLLMGHVDFVMLGTLLLGSIPGVMMGARLSARLPHGVLKIGLAMVLLAVGSKLVIHA